MSGLVDLGKNVNCLQSLGKEAISEYFGNIA